MTAAEATLSNLSDLDHRKQLRRAVVASAIGTTIEWYDFFLYGIVTGLVFAKLYFPNSDPLVGTLQAYTVFFVGFVARPVGAAIFGHYGDRIGRKSMLVLTLVVMGVATFLIGLLPTYEQIGPWAAVVLVVLRIAQGFGVGGEWGGAVLMAVEHAPRGSRGYYGSWPQIGVPAGLLLSTAVFTLFSWLPEEQFLSWGWRVPFLLSILLVAVGLMIRMRILETPAFERIRSQDAAARQPIIEVLMRYPKQVLVAMGARFAENGAFYIFSVFVLTYATQRAKIDRQIVLNGILIGAAVELFAIPLFGALSDKVGRRPVYLFGAIMTAVLAYPLFAALDGGSPFLIVLALTAAFTLSHGAMYAPQAAFMSELFHARVRYSGASLGAQLASVFAGGLAPFIGTALLSAGYGRGAVTVYVVGLAVVTLVAIYIAAETSDTHDDD